MCSAACMCSLDSWQAACAWQNPRQHCQCKKCRGRDMGVSGWKQSVGAGLAHGAASRCNTIPTNMEPEYPGDLTLVRAPAREFLKSTWGHLLAAKIVKVCHMGHVGNSCSGDPSDQRPSDPSDRSDRSDPSDPNANKPPRRSNPKRTIMYVLV